MTDQAIAELIPLIGTRAACRAVGRARASYYRSQPTPPAVPRPTRDPAPQPRALSSVERAEVLGVLHHERFVDQAPASVYARLLDEFWRWRSRGPIGRPRVSAEVRELIATMARENPRWGSERIRGELLKLGLVISKRSIQRYRRRGPAHPPSQTWRSFVANHAHHIWAADLLTVQTLTFKTLYALIFIAHHRRELVHVHVTANPTAAWVWRQVIEATPWGRKPRHLLRDRDAVYGRANPATKQASASCQKHSASSDGMLQRSSPIASPSHSACTAFTAVPTE